MATDANDLFPPEPLISGGRTLVRNGLMQTDMDAQNYRILNLDTSNLVLDELPSQGAVVNKWFNSYDQGTHSFGVLQPAFSNLSGQLSLAQQRVITRLGRIVEGEWIATTISPSHLPTLDRILDPVANVNFAHKRITEVGDPVDDEDAVNLRLINDLAMGLHPKAAVRCATTGNITLAGLSTIDGIALSDNDRVLVKNQGANKRHGIYLAHPGAWTRSIDSDTCADQETASCFILEGDTQSNNTWFQTTPIPSPCNLNEVEFIWQLLSRSSTLQAGDGLQLVGETLNVLGTTNRISVGATVDIDAAYEGQDSITHVGTINAGTWEADKIDGAHGGTNVNNAGKSITLAGDFTTSLGVGAPVGSFLTFALLGATSLTLPVIGKVATTNQDEIFTNKHISADQVDSGVLLITNGGTAANNALDALRNLLPDTTGHAGESLHTDGGTSGPVIFYWA